MTTPETDDAEIAAAVRDADAPSWSIRAAAGHRLAASAEMPGIAEVLHQLILDKHDTGVTYETAAALLHRDDACGMRIVLTALSCAYEPATAEEILALLDNDPRQLTGEGRRRLVAQLGEVVLDSSEPVRAEVERLLTPLLQFGPERRETFVWKVHRPEFQRLSGLLEPAVPVAGMLTVWDAGEWAIAIEDLAEMLSDHHTPLLRADRKAVLALADAFDVSAKAASALRWCPDLESEDEWWREIEDSPRALAISDELSREIGPGHPLHGIPLTPWLECGACDDVLVRLGDENVRPETYRVAVVHPTWSRHRESSPWPSTVVFDQALDALDRLETCFHGASTTTSP